MITVEGLSKSYAGTSFAVQDVSFRVDKGEIVGFLGPNGAGKTTTLRVVAGFLGMTAGKVTVAGHDIIGAPIQAKRSVGYMPESVPLYPEMRVREYLEFRAELKAVPRDKRKGFVDLAMTQVKITTVADKLIRHLSKGYRQRVGLADALVARPPILILDEPTAGLDPNQIREMRSLVCELGREHAILLSTHILPEVEATCDRVAFVKRGRVVHELVLAEMQSGLDVEIRVAHADAALVEGLGEFGSDARLEDGLVRLRVAHERSLPAIARWLASRGAELYELKCRKKTLEEWFIEVMGEDQGPG